MSKLVLGAFNAQFLAYVRPHLAAKIAELELSSRDASLLPSLIESGAVGPLLFLLCGQGTQPRQSYAGAASLG